MVRKQFCWYEPGVVLVATQRWWFILKSSNLFRCGLDHAMQGFQLLLLSRRSYTIIPDVILITQFKDESFQNRTKLPLAVVFPSLN